MEFEFRCSCSCELGVPAHSEQVACNARWVEIGVTIVMSVAIVGVVVGNYRGEALNTFTSVDGVACPATFHEIEMSNE